MTTITINDVVQYGPVIPVLSFESVEQGIEVCQALYKGGIRVFEITLRTAAGLSVIQEVNQIANDVIVGVGTLTHVSQCGVAKKAGAKFGVSPGLTSFLDQAARDHDLPLLPGVMTSSEIMRALDLGYNILKFFPAQQAGGKAMLSAWKGPFHDVKFCPTGGITLETAQDFLNLPNVLCVGGSWLAPADLVKSKQWAKITKLAQQTLKLHRGL